jgi:hypothetical protein
MTGTSVPLRSKDADTSGVPPVAEKQGELYPPLRQLPRLAVPYADLYRSVRVQETVFELLTQQYEMARIEEAKDMPVISVIDFPGVAEKKSFPPRLLITLLLTIFAVGAASAFLLMREGWSMLNPRDPRKQLAAETIPVLRRRLRAIVPSLKRSE